MKWY